MAREFGYRRGALDLVNSAHNPDLGFSCIRPCFFVDESVGSEQLVVGQARSEAQRGLHELHPHEHGAESFYLLEGTDR